MPRSFPDSGVLIDAARSARSDRTLAAIDYFDDPNRTYLTSPFVRLETIPKANYTRRAEELAFYEAFFESPKLEWCRDWDRLESVAEDEARRHGLGALDALHVAAAYLLGADELITTELPRKAIYRTELVHVVYLYS